MNLQKISRGVSTLSLVFILFFCTSGGPYTTETLIHSVGPGLGLLMLLLVPIVWSIPEVLIVGELASMLPEEGGYYRWVDRAELDALESPLNVRQFGYLALDASA